MGEGLTNREVAEIYTTHGHLLLRRCKVVLRDDTLADDALQEVFVRVMRYGASLREARSPLRWLYRVADRCCFDQLDKRKRRPEVSLELDAEPFAEGARSPSDRLAERSLVMTVLTRLSEAERTIAVLAFVDELSQGEIAEATGWSRQTINKKLKRIRERAQRALRRA